MTCYGLIGHPLSHSFSKGYFEGKFKELGLNAEYRNFDFPTVEEAIDAISRTGGLRGVNVTIPFKRVVIPFLHELDPEAEAIGAVNTLRIVHCEEGLRIKGFNTDVIGFRESILPYLRKHHSKALILGTGGAARAAVNVLGKLGISCTSVSRSSGAADLNYEAVTDAVVRMHQLIVNCTPVGMFPNVNDVPNIPLHSVTCDHLLFDMVYNPLETGFMRAGLERGASVVNGLEMLHLQAEASWSIWNHA
jgi:shikimate dehydrogenase